MQRNARIASRWDRRLHSCFWNSIFTLHFDEIGTIFCWKSKTADAFQIISAEKILLKKLCIIWKFDYFVCFPSYSANINCKFSVDGEINSFSQRFISRQPTAVELNYFPLCYNRDLVILFPIIQKFMPRKTALLKIHHDWRFISYQKQHWKTLSASKKRIDSVFVNDKKSGLSFIHEWGNY